MSLKINNEIFDAAAVTGSESIQDRNQIVPHLPAQIADGCIDAAKAIAKNFTFFAKAHVLIIKPVGAISSDAQS